MNSLARPSYFASLPKIPIASATTANIGTPRTNAANIRCTWAAIQTASTGPDHRELPVGANRIRHRGDEQQAVSHQLFASVKNGRRFEKSIGIALRTSASISTVISRIPCRRA